MFVFPCYKKSLLGNTEVGRSNRRQRKQLELKLFKIEKIMNVSLEQVQLIIIKSSSKLSKKTLQHPNFNTMRSYEISVNIIGKLRVFKHQCSSFYLAKKKLKTRQYLFIVDLYMLCGKILLYSAFRCWTLEPLSASEAHL